MWMKLTETMLTTDETRTLRTIRQQLPEILKQISFPRSMNQSLQIISIESFSVINIFYRDGVGVRRMWFRSRWPGNIFPPQISAFLHAVFVATETVHPRLSLLKRMPTKIWMTLRFRYRWWHGNVPHQRARSPTQQITLTRADNNRDICADSSILIEIFRKWKGMCSTHFSFI